MEDKKSIWNEAGSAGLMLGGICIVYMLVSWLLTKLGPSMAVLVSLCNVLLWAAKFAGCIWLFKKALQRYSDKHPEADNHAVFKYGALVAFLSALIYSAFYMAYMIYIAPDQIREVFDTLADNPMLGSASLDSLEEMLPKMPTIGFFVNLVYCTLFGTVLSAIFSRNIPPQNPFFNNNPDRQ